MSNNEIHLYHANDEAENFLESGQVPPSSRKNVGTIPGDYYEKMAMAKEVRPITITEGLEWNSMPHMRKLLWSFGTCIQMLTLTIFSLRTDRLLEKSYLAKHWKHYLG